VSKEIEHSPIYDWVPCRSSYTGRELRGVYCTCGSDDYEEECVDVDASVYDSRSELWKVKEL
jgi:hypothetical protein